VIDDLLRKAEVCERSAFQWMLDSMMSRVVKELEQKAKAGPLNKWHHKILRLAASTGDGRVIGDAFA
jgi:hypothetical protein